MQGSRERMVATAARLFARHGYHAVGFRRIVEESGAPRGSIYHHFPDGKEQLGAEAISFSGAMMVASVERVVAQGSDVASILEQLGELLTGWLERSEFAEGCPVATVALETASDTPRVADACRAVFRDWRQVLRDRLVAEGWDAEQADGFATTTVAAFEGALLLARIERDVAPVRAVARDLAGRAR
jgi:TetR/AcrR family transcriptional regulator, lmrAB and yxaGH operons repressor